MAMNNASIQEGSVYFKNPTGGIWQPTSWGFTPASGMDTRTLERNWNYTDNGTWEVWTSADVPGLDDAGNPVVAAKQGEFVVNIAPPVDTTPPTYTLNSITPPSITAAGTLAVVVSGQWVD